MIGWRERILAAHPSSDPGFWPDALLVEHMAAEIADLRAALAQPSPAEEAAEDREKPEIVAFIHDRTGAVANADMVRAMEKGSVPSGYAIGLMTVTQHDRMALERWQYFRRKMRQMRDLMRGMRDRLNAAQAKVAELEKQEPVATVSKVPGEGWNSLDFHRDLQDMQPGTKLYAAPVAPAQDALPPFAEKVLTKLRRFNECAEDSDSGGVDIGRHWLDLLTQLGLLNRVQRSPALWEISQQGEDLLGLDVPEIEVPDSMIEKAWQRFERTLQQLEAPGHAYCRYKAERDAALAEIERLDRAAASQGEPSDA
ncbi:hypothetical protein [Pseudomonas aeruginosa]|uniref:hypothetical protein n=1 Tax=Pseudomonas aeruginosa TaxID=287 RepID=UPI0037479A22